MYLYFYRKLNKNLKIKKSPNSFYISDTEIPIEKCNVESFYSNHVTINRPCFIQNKNSPFYEKTNFVLNKSKVLDEGFLELKKLIDLGNVEEKKLISFKKELIGVMNMLGTPKISNALNFENMHMEFVIKNINTLKLLNHIIIIRRPGNTRLRLYAIILNIFTFK